MTDGEELFDKVRADEPRSTRHQHAHRATVETEARRGKGGTGFVFLLVLLFLLGLGAGIYFRFGRELAVVGSGQLELPSPLTLAALPTATRFDFPIGSEHGAFAYNAQPFTENRHLGDDLNGIGGENSDFGDPVFAIGDGQVLFADDGGPGWGNIIILLHAFEENGVRRYVQSYYAHLDTMLAQRGQTVQRGQPIGTIGNASGRYWAHLHFEMREFLNPFIGPGYREDTRGWINPSEFIRHHRGAPEDDVGRSAVVQEVQPVQQAGGG